MSKEIKGFTHRNYPREHEHFSASGTEYELVYGYEFDEFGAKRLVPIEKHNFNLDIQINAPMCDINAIVARATADPSVLNQVHGFYADVTEMPTTLAEVFNRSESAQRTFNEMPADFKEMFNNNFTEFWAQIGTEQFNAKLKDFEKSVNDIGIKYKGKYYNAEQIEQILMNSELNNNKKVGDFDE